MFSDIDIIEIDYKIKKMFKDAKEHVHVYVNRLEEINKTLQNPNINKKYIKSLTKNKNDMIQIIHKLENDINLNFYLFESEQIITKYKNLLNIPVKVNFMGKPLKKNNSKELLISKYLNTACKYIDIDYKKKDKKITCKNCNNNKFEIINKNIYICTNCFSQQSVIMYVSSYNDSTRINISTKYMYDRKIHFRDCINQYQGKQNNSILQKVYDDLIEQFQRHHLVNNQYTDKKRKFSRITKEHILMFLKELNHTKHYENVHLIHYNITNVKPDDISYLEQQLLYDFDALTELYDKRFKHIKRKNFINTQYVLFQLLRRHKHDCDKNSFTNLKTLDRKSFHDDICKTLFEELGWNHEPYY